jgi:hypothetical protein
MISSNAFQTLDFQLFFEVIINGWKLETQKKEQLSAFTKKFLISNASWESNGKR